MIGKLRFPPFQFRYVCPNCHGLRTFLSEEYHEDWICWGCGEKLEVIPKREEKK